MIKLDRPVIVEGKYDVIRLSNIIDSLIIKTDGFGIFKDKEKQKLLRSLAKEKGIIVLTDSDGAGFVIRNFIKSIVPADKIINVYIPDVFGKEKRKTDFSAEGKLGVEGMKESLLLEAFEKAGVTAAVTNEKRRLITPLDLYEHGLSRKTEQHRKKKKAS